MEFQIKGKRSGLRIVHQVESNGSNNTELSDKPHPQKLLNQKIRKSKYLPEKVIILPYFRNLLKNPLKVIIRVQTSPAI